ncbi:hypothetical protein [Flavobacterium sp.]|uniref:hypothetical protein n=1 Tax=Flavobacterium sp. TaxID=239 RepID=UPI00286E6857|nr:hypothetical protein [Flavobacterium sp.]
MKICPSYSLVFLFFFNSCGQKFYAKKDFTFFDKNFILDSSSSLRTDGVYVLENIWTSRNGDTTETPKNSKFYIFYKKGQSNLILLDTPFSEDNLASKINDTVTTLKKTSTLFQGYYKIKDGKIIIQNVNTSLRQFNYSYGFIENNKLIIVKKTIEGNGKFEDKYFTDYYKETYVFKKIDTVNPDIEPNW